MIEELQRTVIGLSRDNKDLNDRNENLRRQLMELGTKYPQVVPLHAVMGGSLAEILAQTPLAPTQVQSHSYPPQQVQNPVPMPLQYQNNVSNENDHALDPGENQKLDNQERENAIQGATKFSVPIPVSTESPSPTSDSLGFQGGMQPSNNMSDMKQNVDSTI